MQFLAHTQKITKISEILREEVGKKVFNQPYLPKFGIQGA